MNRLFNPKRDELGDLETINLFEFWVGDIWIALHWSWPPMNSFREDNEGGKSWHRGPLWLRAYPH